MHNVENYVIMWWTTSSSRFLINPKNNGFYFYNNIKENEKNHEKQLWHIKVFVWDKGIIV